MMDAKKIKMVRTAIKQLIDVLSDEQVCLIGGLLQTFEEKLERQKKQTQTFNAIPPQYLN